MPAVGDATGSHRFTGPYTGSESRTPVCAPFLSRERVLGSWLALRRLWCGFGVALGSHWYRIEVALGWLWSRNRLPINRLWSGFEVALGGFEEALVWLWGSIRVALVPH